MEISFFPAPFWSVLLSVTEFPSGIMLVFKSRTVEENLFVGLCGGGTLVRSFPAGSSRRCRRRGPTLGQPSVLPLDEPLEGPAPVICDELMAAATELAATRAMRILLVEQRIKAALEFAEGVMILERGRVAWTGTPAELATRPQTVEGLLGVGH